MSRFIAQDLRYLIRLVVLAASFAGSVHAAVPRGLLDHAICCGPKPSMHAEDFVETGYDPMLRRHRYGSPAAATEAPAEPPKIPGTDGLVQDVSAASSISPPPALPGPTSGTPVVATAPPEPMRPLVAPTEKIDGHLRVGFDVLGGYPFQLTKEDALATSASEAAVAAKALAQIPDVVRALDGKKVLLTGFMLPMKMEGPLATEFLLVANSMLCCYGIVPAMNQWAVVKMAKGGVKPQPDVPVQFFGTLRVQPRFDGGALSAIYHFEADRLRAPK